MIGVDIENISRIQNLYIKKSRLLEKMFNQTEWEYAKTKANPSQTLTGIWCAKEAVVKAIFSIDPIFIKEITILYKESGEPFAEVNSKIVNSTNINISISHSKDYATAVAIYLK